MGLGDMGLGGYGEFGAAAEPGLDGYAEAGLGGYGAFGGMADGYADPGMMGGYADPNLGYADDLGLGVPAGYADPSLGAPEIGFSFGLDTAALGGLTGTAAPSAADVFGVDAMAAMGVANVAEVMGFHQAQQPSFGAPGWGTSGPANPTEYDPYSAYGWGAPSYTGSMEPYGLGWNSVDPFAGTISPASPYGAAYKWASPRFSVGASQAFGGITGWGAANPFASAAQYELAFAPAVGWAVSPPGQAAIGSVIAGALGYLTGKAISEMKPTGTPEEEPQQPATSPEIDPKELAGKTPQEIDKIAQEKGLIAKGPDPINGRGSYIDPVTGEQRINIDKNHDHYHVNNPQGQRVDINGNPVEAKTSEAYLPLNR